MDPMLMQATVAVLASLLMQMVKREYAGGLENIILAGLITTGSTQLAGYFGWDVGIVQPVIMAYAFHGVFGDQIPMSKIKLALIDRFFDGVGGAFSSVASKPKPPSP